MTYDQLKEIWIRALQESMLPIRSGEVVEESLDLRSMSRRCRSAVEPFGRQAAPPFHVSAAFEYS